MLSERARHFLKTLDRKEVPRDRNEVAECFRSRALPAPDAILAFQESFGGYAFQAGLEPVVATVLFPKADYLRDQPWTVPDTTMEDDRLLYSCFDTLWQCDFHLDSDGTYYENGEAVHEDFSRLTEGIALLAACSASGRWERMPDADASFGDPSNFPSQGLRRDDAASCRFTTWWVRDDLVVRRRADYTVAWKPGTPAE